jgi:hypothetical protein
MSNIAMTATDAKDFKCVFIINLLRVSTGACAGERMDAPTKPIFGRKYYKKPRQPVRENDRASRETVRTIRNLFRVIRDTGRILRNPFSVIREAGRAIREMLPVIRTTVPAGRDIGPVAR